MKKVILATATALILSPTLVLAKADHTSSGIQFNGPVDLSTVDSLLADSNMFTEKNVVVDGNIVRQVKGDTFVFSDGKSEIQIEIDDDVRLNQAIDATTNLRIFGEFEGGNTPEIEVDRIQLL
ncbi:NirD/YgiW/YdeI family stress tolerance protein [Vibrio sp. Isolate23]|uniref:YgiW/YdeI family stress tolerance OB fold protein n=1 Tax=Vibrio TaxID=662 RepID=UPI001EFD83A3|nr:MULTISPECIES: NirD/YgiW/YdeI family stress tolerance protein [Vibrio]MCG9677247.1 NirD/YgiW/YdeI family stress tolerance protein [Vibrio sp. Isolate24]MCG9685022.1 NirD/YgiW/YdeI family stress tolerance protein [Vibrio sp. Isolate23]USD35338.1 NirD/YgiW/YdeI family stress tolerance protein [Vibrio sp. SCSIO 43186]USD48404.1 NirD/YgiW/YdeI family stress tolerance protein [Vibrio sp. SCSIO 43145]USD72463.1 NirD/YgiW/YdeI family stress tolerance protein [Vibrio sp. SCSIO 43139]